MDDDEDERDFSKQIVLDFFDQAKTTFQQMDTGL
jgi:osomolarity two-component system, phosphorelay intermediate protein YPD1